MSWGAAFNFGLGVLGLNESMQANAISAEMQKEQMALTKEMLDMAKLREDYDTELRDDQKLQIDKYQKTLKDVFDRLGTRKVVTADSIRGDANNFFDQNVGDLNQVIDRVNSQGYANQRSRGMLDSSVEDDRKRELTTKYAGLMSSARTDAQDRAFKKASDFESLTDLNRSNITGEYDDYYTKPFDMMNTARKSDGSGALGAAATLTGNSSTNAQNNANAATSAFGRELENLRENDWSFDYSYKPDKKD